MTKADANAIAVNDYVKQALEMRVAGLEFNQIAETLGVPRKSIELWVKAYLVANPAKAADAYREQELARMERYRDVLATVVHIKHIKTSAGAIVRDPDTLQPLLDYEPVIKAIMTDIKISERVSKMLGSDKPAPVSAPPVQERDAPVINEAMVIEEVRRMLERSTRKREATDVEVRGE